MYGHVPAFQVGVAAHFKNASIIFDPFHVMKMVNEAIAQIRREEVKESDLLKQTRRLWLMNPESLTTAQTETITQLQLMNLATARAHQMKLNLKELWNLPDRQSNARHLEAWCRKVVQSDISIPLKKAATA